MRAREVEITHAEAGARAHDVARELNLPWGGQVTARRRRVWPFPAHWRVQARDAETAAITRMIVRERPPLAWSAGVVYPRVGGAPPRSRPRGSDLLRIAVGVSAAVLLAVFLRWPLWTAAILAPPATIVALIVFRRRIRAER